MSTEKQACIWVGVVTVMWLAIISIFLFAYTFFADDYEQTKQYHQLALNISRYRLWLGFSAGLNVLLMDILWGLSIP